MGKTYTIFKPGEIDKNMQIKEKTDHNTTSNEDQKNRFNLIRFDINDEKMSFVSNKIAFWDKIFTKQGCPKETIGRSSHNNKTTIGRKDQLHLVEEKTKEENIDVSIDTDCELNMTSIVPNMSSEAIADGSSGDVQSKKVLEGPILDKTKFEKLTETAKLALKQALKKDTKVVNKFENEFYKKYGGNSIQD